jgi:hypothetical protein
LSFSDVREKPADGLVPPREVLPPRRRHSVGHSSSATGHPLHHAYGLPVARFERDGVLALKGWGAFVVEPREGERTRLLARGRTARGPAVILNALLIEIPHFVMERKMLLGIKRRAERAFVGTVA